MKTPRPVKQVLSQDDIELYAFDPTQKDGILWSATYRLWGELFLGLDAVPHALELFSGSWRYDYENPPAFVVGDLIGTLSHKTDRPPQEQHATRVLQRAWNASFGYSERVQAMQTLAKALCVYSQSPQMRLTLKHSTAQLIGFTLEGQVLPHHSWSVKMPKTLEAWISPARQVLHVQHSAEWIRPLNVVLANAVDTSQHARLKALVQTQDAFKDAGWDDVSWIAPVLQHVSP